MENEIINILLRFENVLNEINKSLTEIKNYINSNNNSKFLDLNFKNAKDNVQVELSKSLIELLEENRIENINDNRLTKLNDYLKRNNIKVKSFGSNKLEPNPLNNLVKFIGQKFYLVKPFIERLKSTLNDGNQFSMFLGNLPSESISAICQLGQELSKYALLENFTYLRSPKYLVFAKPNRIPATINFISGKWAELFIQERLNQIISKIDSRVTFEILVNPILLLPNGTEIELDLLFQIDNEIFLIEVKTGNYQSFIPKYQNVNKYLKLQTDNCYLLIVEEMDEKDRKIFSQLHNIRVLKVTEFYSEFLIKIKKIIEASSDESEIENPITQ